MSAVIGTLLMLTITVVVFSALGIAALEYFDNQEPPARADIVVVRGDGTAILTHRGGQALNLADGRLILNDGATDVHVLFQDKLSDPDFTGQTADGVTWRIGESLCIVGSAAACLYGAGTDIHGILFVYEERVVVDEGTRAFLLPFLLAGRRPAPSPAPQHGKEAVQRPISRRTGAAPKRGPTDDAGVSSVVSAVLVFALIMTMTTLWSVQTAPDWIEEREARHQDQAADGFRAVRAGIDSLSAANDPGPITVPFRLAANPIPLFQRTPGFGALEADGAVSVAGSFPSASVHLINGGSAGAPAEAIDGDVISGIQELQELILSLKTVDVGTNEEAWVQVEADNGATTATLRMTHAGSGKAVDCTNTELRVSLEFDGETSYHVLACAVSDDLSSRRIDALDPLYGFDAAIRSMTGSLTLTFTKGLVQTGQPPTVDGTFSAVWTVASGLTETSGGTPPALYTFSQAGQTLRFEPRYQELMQQELRLEPGGLVRVQPDGQVVAAAPSFSMDVAGTIGYLRWTLTELTGSGSVGGKSGAEATLRHTQTSRVLFDAPAVTAPAGTITFTGVSGDAWRAFFEDQALLAGATDSVDVGGTGGTVELKLRGTENGGTITLWRVDLRLVQAQVQVK